MTGPRPLARPNSRFAGDDGAPDPAVREALRGAEDSASYVRAVVALCTSRLLLPIVASGDVGGDGPDPNRKTEMAAVTLSDHTGTYLMAFTGMDALRAWRPDARPVPCLLDELAATVEPAGATRLLIDAAGPVPFVIEGDTLVRLADGQALVELGEGQFGWVKPASMAEGSPA